SAYLMRDEFADKAGAVTRSLGSCNQRATCLPPLKQNAFRRSPVRSARPGDGHPTLGRRQCAVLCGVGHEFVKHHRYRFGRSSGEHDLGTVNGGVSAIRVGGELMANQISKTDTHPPTVT